MLFPHKNKIDLKNGKLQNHCSVIRELCRILRAHLYFLVAKLGLASRCLAILQKIVSVPRFEMVTMFMSSADKKGNNLGTHLRTNLAKRLCVFCH